MSERIKVVHITTVHKRFDSRIFYKECSSLANKGYEVFMIVADGKGDDEVSGVKILDVGLETNRVRKLFVSCYKAYKKAKELNADIYHFHDPDFLPWGKRIKQRTNIVLFDSHEDFPSLMLQRSYIPSYLRKFLFNITTLLEKSCTRKITGVITATETIKEKFQNYGLKHIQIIKNYPILKPFETEVKEIKEETEPIACYVGGLTSVRGVREMILSCAIAKVRLFLVGEFDDMEFFSQMKNLPQWDNVTFFDYVNHEELYKKIYSQSTLGLVLLHSAPNHTHSIPIKQLEYMQAKLPVVCTSEINFCKEITEKTGCGIVVNPLDIEETAKAIMRICQDKSLAKQMSEKGYEATTKEYNWISQETALLEFYQTLTTK